MKFLLASIWLVVVAAQANGQTSSPTAGQVVYQSGDLTITQVAPNTFVHTSFLNTQSFGRVACNGMVVRSGAETVVFDTPTSDKESKELIRWITTTLHCKVNAVVPTHFHEDCVGGLPEFARNNIPSYANQKTITYAKQRKFNVPQRGFANSLTLDLGGAKVYARFFGEGHTRDNIVGYFPADEVLFGGCLIKELNATKGNLADANLQAWPATVTKLKKACPNLRVVIPGHGQVGDTSLLDYTIRLFQQ
ncbi:subclass B1 metallo-beta-lactamase [Hymenobacter oligotrophus]|uniref:beta-lactamase n=1 Tax=Hymenobacter oligotrophus TaxID=2319843 RepID=A0A3B7RTA1_9BACT|nr:subclass B1 metallo-beta-lactamase [Hymenobacter oligotrophus]AYA37367.1 subclass B1 metallo-beta-lactamase [Hymenobacter oligotrophus]